MQSSKHANNTVFSHHMRTIYDISAVVMSCSRQTTELYTHQVNRLGRTYHTDRSSPDCRTARAACRLPCHSRPPTPTATPAFPVQCRQSGPSTADWDSTCWDECSVNHCWPEGTETTHMYSTSCIETVITIPSHYVPSSTVVLAIVTTV